jgi:sulfide:quinone oxidoreductase
MSLNVLIAGGGIAGLEALLGLRAVAGERVNLTLVAPDPDFTYRPLAVAEPFALGRAHRVPLADVAGDAGARLVVRALAEVDDAAGAVRLDDGATLPFDALIVAPGARPVSGVDGATTWWPGGDPEIYGGLLRDVEEGYSKRLAMVVPPGAVWPLPVYELALMTAGEARSMGRDDLAVTVVTPEHEPLSLFGPEASAAVREELRAAGIELRTGVIGRGGRGGLVLHPGGERLPAQRVFAVPRLLGPAVAGLPRDGEGFIVARDDARVNGCERTWAAGDGVVSPVKLGGVATHQARRAVAAIARLAGVADAPDPGEPVVHGRLLTGGGRLRRLAGRGNSHGAPLWWPAGKVAGEYLPRWLADRGVTPRGAAAPPAGGIAIRRPLRDMTGPEERYLYELARRFRVA